MYNPKFFENPEEFNVKRWDFELKDSMQYVPFSGGGRNCIGQHFSQVEMKIFLISILRNYKIVPITNKKAEYEIKFNVNLKDSNLYEFVKL